LHLPSPVAQEPLVHLSMQVRLGPQILPAGHSEWICRTTELLRVRDRVACFYDSLFRFDEVFVAGKSFSSPSTSPQTGLAQGVGSPMQSRLCKLAGRFAVGVFKAGLLLFTHLPHSQYWLRRIRVSGAGAVFASFLFRGVAVNDGDAFADRRNGSIWQTGNEVGSLSRWCK
jgi:hypothetical protein